jgi:hypothetical protein
LLSWEGPISSWRDSTLMESFPLPSNHPVSDPQLPESKNADQKPERDDLGTPPQRRYQETNRSHLPFNTQIPYPHPGTRLSDHVLHKNNA